MVETEAQVDELAAELQRVLSKLFSVLRRGDANRGTSGDLTLAQLSILLTGAIRRLATLGLVKRSRDPSDLRAVLVEVTPRGLVQHREALAARRAALAAMLGKLTEDDVETLTKALGPMERLADKEPGHEEGDRLPFG